MPKHLLAALLGLSSLSGHAQTLLPKSGWQFEGNVSFAKSYGENVGGAYSNSQGSSYFNIYPSVGYLVADNLALGLSGSYLHTNYNGTSDNGSSTLDRTGNTYSVGPFADAYRLFTSYFGLKGRLAAGYGHNSEVSVYSSPTNYERIASTGHSLYGSLVPSLLFFPVPRLALGASLGGLYYSQNWSQTPAVVNGDGQGYNFYASFGLSQLALSGTFYPGRK